MLDQSFSSNNFRIILDVENRKGNYIEHREFFGDCDVFQESRRISDIIITKNHEIRAQKKKIRSINEVEALEYEKLDQLIKEKESLIDSRENARLQILHDISLNINKEDFRLKISKGSVKHGAQLYTLEDTPESFFVSKQLQRNIYKTFKVSQSDRRLIINQIRLLLEDGFPKVVIRSDIKQFYESIPHKNLLELIDQNSLLSYPSKNLIRKVLNDYWNILIEEGTKIATDKRVGIPRGVGISAYLSELYLRSFDKKVKSLSGVTFYKRYVDDIIIIYTPNSKQEIKAKKQYEVELKRLLYESTGLEINATKTELFDLKKKPKTTKKMELTYLGYKFLFGWKKENSEVSRIPLSIMMSDKKFIRNSNKLTSAFQEYLIMRNKFIDKQKGASKLLLHRIQLLTKNYRLVRRKKNVIIGVYFSNEFLSEPHSDLNNLDKILKEQINMLPEENKTDILLKKKLRKLSFVKGFKEKSLVKFSPDTFKSEKVLRIWKNL